MYGVVRFDGRLVVYNRTIQGPTGDGVHRKPERFVGDFSAGIVLRVSAVEISIIELYRSRELPDPPDRAAHNVLQLDVTFLYQ